MTLTVLHEAIRKTQPNAPRMDQLGKQGLIKIADRLEVSLPQNATTLHTMTMAGDIVANSIYYSLVPGASGRHAWKRSAFLGMVARLGALVLPKPLGLDPQESNRTRQTQLLTLGLYLSGALVTGVVYSRLTRTSAVENPTVQLQYGNS